MKKSVKAALWSGLAFPGVGQFILKRHQRGMILFVPALISMVLYVKGLLQQVDFVMSKIESGAVPLDPVAISAMLDNVPQSQMVEIAFWVFVVCWVIGIVDAYVLGRSLEVSDASTKSA
ncbi:MAG TPA: hypothetical protein VNW52_12120 [Burkholderiaceae bacterium]|jgi:hypothetical protein|nr:hypothetical protein [Burkholderiaceae bacterium]